MLWHHSRTPSGMNRRHFMKHAAGASALTGAALAMGHTLRVHADDLKKRRKSAILLWMGGGPATIDLWDLKPARQQVDHSKKSAPAVTYASANTCQ